ARQQLDTQQSLVNQLQSTVTSDTAQRDNAKLNLVYCHIVSPVTGRVGLRQVDQGNYVQVSDAPGIVVVTEITPISVVFTLPQDDLPAILKRLKAGASLSVTAYDRSRTTALAQGTLMALDNMIDTSTGTLKMRALFDNTDGNLFPNQFVNAELLVDTLNDATIVPVAAIQRGAPGTFVYVIGADEIVSVRPVKLGPGNGENVAIRDGLVPGEKVVIDGADKLREGSKVAVPGEHAGNGQRSKPTTP
ncbi:MAG TPA: efflux RND transporter periplasmic adaptor subunit, partial [Stellaceae bacterium]|nr:efflux RND transporter periplasmic adaptor subunit [Stellaceae bacterium]